MDYKNGKIYRLVYGDKQYVGSTTQPLYKRRHEHKLAWQRGDTRTTSSILFEEAHKDNGEVEIVLIEEFPCTNRDQLRQRERHWFENIEGGCINKRIPITTSQEHKEKNRKRNTKYREANRQNIRQRHKKWEQENKTKIKTKRSEKITCECGVEITRGCMSKHKKRKIHQDFLNGTRFHSQA